MTTLILYPGYGRRPTTKAEVMKQWEDGKDFLIEGGPYCSIRDINLMKEKGVTHLIFGTYNGKSLGSIKL